VVHAFDADQGFGFDKAARDPCRHLQADHRCAIHARLMAEGFPGCVSFDCYGAGQRVTEQFGGQTWRDSPTLATRMFAAYDRRRALHEMQAMARLAMTRVDGRNAQALQELLARLEHLCEIDEPIDTAALRRQVQQQIRAVLSPPGST
jgi:hypothetical protein